MPDPGQGDYIEQGARKRRLPFSNYFGPGGVTLAQSKINSIFLTVAVVECVTIRPGIEPGTPSLAPTA